MADAAVHGLPPDPTCLHCVLVPIIAAFHRRNADKPPEQLIAELLHTTADMIASYADNVESTLQQSQELLRELTRDADAEFRNVGMRSCR